MSLAKQILIVGWDGADWQIINPLMEQGKMPHLQGLIERGVMGNFASMHPMISPMLWTTMATGKSPSKHGVCGFTEPDAYSDNGRRLVGSTSRKCKAFWNILSQENFRTHVVGWYAGHPAEPINGVCVSERFAKAFQTIERGWPVAEGSVHPQKFQSTLEELRIHPQQIGLEHLRSFVPDAEQIDQSQDNRLATLAKNISQCATNQAITTWIMETQPWDVVAAYFNTIDLISHSFMYFHPPRMSHVPLELFERYKNVVGETYRFHDLMLGRLLQLAGEQATVIVVSDHGYRCGANRPLLTSAEPAGAIQWHRPCGVIAMQGPAIRQDELIFGGRILDLTPTILTLLGLPVGEDMAGSPLIQAFRSTVEVQTIPSWENVEGDAGMHDTTQLQDSIAELEMMKQLEALGYLEPVSGNKQMVLERTADEIKFNLARSQIGLGQHSQAVADLESIVEHQPRRLEAALTLADCYQALGETEKCRRLIEKIAASEFEDRAVESRTARLRPQLDYLLGLVELNDGNNELALGHLLTAEQAMEPHLARDFHKNLGQAYLRLQRWSDASRAFDKALLAEPDDATSLHGLAIVALHDNRPDDAVDYALQSLQILFHSPQAHFHLGLACWQMGDLERAKQAFETSLAMRPQADEVRQKLRELISYQTG